MTETYVVIIKHDTSEGLVQFMAQDVLDFIRDRTSDKDDEWQGVTAMMMPLEEM